MNASMTRRDFVKTAAIVGAGTCAGVTVNGGKLIHDNTNAFYRLSESLLGQWGKGLLSLQVSDPANSSFGAILCPACDYIHGRIGDAFYPFLFLADRNKDDNYLDAALRLYDWAEENVSTPDGAWINEPDRPWKGITVFGAVGLAEALKNHGHILEPAMLAKMKTRLKAAGQFIHDTFHMEYGNINYPITASYALTLIGQYLEVPSFVEKGRYFAHESLKFITSEDKFIFGEGKPLDVPSEKGCYSIDLGYNVEESLPALAMYSLLTNDKEILEQTVSSMKTHMEFMLPDGGWDNSWGTRNFKWTYWGSRTSDGCQPAYALLADQDPGFQKVALKNTELLQKCTENNLLHGGPHYMSHGIPPCVHHTFCHSKALAVALDHKPDNPPQITDAKLPRERISGIRTFPDIQTWLVSKGKFRATVTGYDREYAMRNGHATGGALSMLWHDQVGPIFSASMGEYQMIERFNMQPDNGLDTMCLTPRIEWADGAGVYKNVNDLTAVVTSREVADSVMINTESQLVNGDQESPATGNFKCHVDYVFNDDTVVLKFRSLNRDHLSQIILPVISKQDETVKTDADGGFVIKKKGRHLKITSDQEIRRIPISGERIFNHVPGLEALPLVIKSQTAEVTIKII